jgi:sec-independent protein translocase protein TatC
MMKRQQRKKTPRQKQTTNQSQPSAEPEQQTFIEHLYELRTRLFWVVASLIVTSAIGFQYKDILVDFIMAPLQGQKLVYLTPGGGFSFIFTVCLYFGALLTIPVVMYHIYRFLQPVLGQTSKKLISIIILVSSLLALGGAAFGYFVAVPAAIQFLMTFAGDAVTPNLTAESYLGFIVAYMLGLAALFQLPLLLYIIDHVRPFPPGALLSSQRFVIVGAVIAAALITPTPDVVNQLIVAGPIILVYQLGAIAVFLRRKIGRRAANRPSSAQSEWAANSLLDEVIAEGVAVPPAVVQAEPAISPQVEAHATQPPMHATPIVQSKHLQPAAVTARQPRQRRSIDGMTRRTPAVPQRPSAKPVQKRRPARSVDGFSLVEV